MKNILLCCNAMGIGGVETVILNQVLAFTSKNYNVYVVAERGEYTQKVEELGGNFIEIEFPEENNIDIDRVNKIVEIIKQKNITEIHIHKYQCIPTVLTAALMTNTPYFAYEHGIKDTKKYYTWNYPIYNSLFPIYFENAYKIIAITPNVANRTKNEYKLSDEKYAIVHNGIDFNVYYNDNPNYSNNIKKILIISRINTEKLTTVFNGIEVFNEIFRLNNEARLTIVGGGNSEKELKDYLRKNNLEYTENNEKNAIVSIEGKQTDIIKYLKETDLLLGVDRCVLEAISMKVPAIITGYDGIKGLVSKDNINIAMEENFSGFNMSTITKEEYIKDILFLKNNRKKIIEEVYEVAKEKLDCYKNYINICENQDTQFDFIGLFNLLKEKENFIINQSEDIKKKYEWIQKLENKNEELLKEIKKTTEKNVDIEEKNKKIKQELDCVNKEITDIYNSKRWKIAEKINGIFHRKIDKEKK